MKRLAKVAVAVVALVVVLAYLAAPPAVAAAAFHPGGAPGQKCWVYTPRHDSTTTLSWPVECISFTGDHRHYFRPVG